MTRIDDFAGKRVLITGGSSGIGAAAARAFAAQGAIATPFHAKTPAARMDAMRDATAMGRVGVAEDCVGAFLFLASNELSGYVTGSIVHVNGGMLMP